MYLCSDKPHFSVLLLTDICHTCGHQIKTVKCYRPTGTAVLSEFNPSFISIAKLFLLHLLCGWGQQHRVKRLSVLIWRIIIIYFFRPVRSVQQPQWCEMHTKRKIYGTSNIRPKFNNRISNEGTINKGSRFLSHDRRLCVDNVKEIWGYCYVKGLVHPRMKIYHPHIQPHLT